MKIQQKLAIRFVSTKINLLSVLSKRKAGEEAFRIFCTPPIRYKGKMANVFINAEPIQFFLNDQHQIFQQRSRFP